MPTDNMQELRFQEWKGDAPGRTASSVMEPVKRLVEEVFSGPDTEKIAKLMAVLPPGFKMPKWASVGEPVGVAEPANTSPGQPNPDQLKLMEWAEAEAAAGKDPLQAMLDKLDDAIAKDQTEVAREQGDQLAKQRAKYTRGLEGKGERRVINEAAQQRDYVRGNVKEMPKTGGPLPASVGTGVGTGMVAGIASSVLPSAVFVSEYEKTQELGPQLEFLAKQHDRPLRVEDVTPETIEDLKRDSETREQLYEQGILGVQLNTQATPDWTESKKMEKDYEEQD